LRQLTPGKIGTPFQNKTTKQDQLSRLKGVCGIVKKRENVSPENVRNRRNPRQVVEITIEEEAFGTAGRPRVANRHVGTKLEDC